MTSQLFCLQLGYGLPSIFFIFWMRLVPCGDGFCRILCLNKLSGANASGEKSALHICFVGGACGHGKGGLGKTWGVGRGAEGTKRDIGTGGNDRCGMRATRDGDDPLLVGGVNGHELVGARDARAVAGDAGHNGLQVACLNSFKERNLVDPAAEDENSIFAGGQLGFPYVCSHS